MSNLTPEAKSKLSSTIRTLRERLLTDLHNAVDSAYQLSIPLHKAGLSAEMRVKRQRLEKWLEEKSRSERRGKEHLKKAEKLAAATLLNRLVVIKQMEAHGLIKPAVVTGGWQSKGYREFRDFAPELLKDESEGYSTLLQLLYDELALDLPGLFGNVGVTVLFPIPTSTLRAVIDALNEPALTDAWLDDTTLGWVYQYWNDPEREALDDKLNGGGKVEQHEIASKTQMFTERYMVEWMLHNSLGQMWLAMCKKNDWVAAVAADGTLETLAQRRKIWREKREVGEVALDGLMPIESEAEDRWKYWVPQPLTDSLVKNAPKSIKNLKILDPACGSGHFLVIAIGLLFALYQEEARHRGESWSDKEIVESILENNLYGIDIDPRAVQIAAAALILKARLLSAQAQPKRLNLVASSLELSALPENDPALEELRNEVTEATGISENLTNRIVKALKGADYLGTLLKIDAEVDSAIRKYEQESFSPVQMGLFDDATNNVETLYITSPQLSAYSESDSLEHPTTQIIRDTWQKYGAEIAPGKTLRDWLRLSFFKEVHLKMYESRPIYFPLSSQKKNFVAFISIHRWEDDTLQTLLADYLIPELSRMEGELNDLMEARNQSDKKSQNKAEERYNKVLQLQTELKTFIELVQKCAEEGTPPASPKDTPREADARFKINLDDGVMVNSAALWSLLEPQWNQPKKWWSELCNAQGKKDYDWSHLAARYFPERVDAKCQQDPSLAVAHGCFWKYHPQKAYEWELRLQDEIAPDFVINEIDSDKLREEFEAENPELVLELKEKEDKRRERKRKKEDTDNDFSLDITLEEED
ncbi:MAG: N-6 DNA methylase [Rivularia sp. T60_A2020_040]|nr:N-6 DNA methylase [Rivularia sp. T60_A2020_040]